LSMTTARIHLSTLETRMAESPIVGDLNTPFLQGLPSPDRDVVISSAQRRRFSADSTVYHQGESADTLFLLLEGCARFFFLTKDGRKILLLWLSPGAIFGASALLARRSAYLAGAETVTDSVVLSWDRDTIRSLAKRYPTLLDNAFCGAAEFLRWYLAHHESLVCDTASERLAHVLVSLAASVGEQTTNGTKLKVTNEQLANAANVTSYTASRYLSQWQRSGAVEKSRGAVFVRSTQQLFVNAY
jgi:CRP/FNR family transcriptional regulator, nitrogen oxide reductase regulator